LVEKNVLVDTVLHFLGLADLSRVQLTGSTMQAALADSSVWFDVARMSLPCFELDSKNFETLQRSRFLPLLMPFLKAACVVDAPVPLVAFDETQRLSKLLVNFQRAALMQQAKGGKAASVHVARLCFPGGGLSAALEKDSRSEMCFAVPIVCPIGERLARAMNTTSKELRLHFAWRAGRLLVVARDDLATSEEIRLLDDPSAWPYVDGQLTAVGPTLTVDVVSASPSLLLHHRDHPVVTNGPWQMYASSMLSLNKGKDAAVSALRSGILCVVLLKDRCPRDSKCFFNSLNLG
jgi:hypothetical protein